MCCSIPAIAAKQKQFVVAIDAGHGGKDTGANENGVTEKEINLGVAKKLAEILKKKGFKVIMTRDNDKFINLSDRPAKANKEKADLFISIHTNSVDASNPNRKNVEGSQVYVLGLHRDADNLEVARRENSVIVHEKNHEDRYEGFDPNKDESYIVFEMAQKKSLANSIGFAQEVQRELVKTAGRRDRGVHQAGFLVLREAAMPAVLVEVDFICNPNSAKYIGSSAGQKKLAQAIANAVVNYRNSIKKNSAIYDNASLDDETDANDIFVLGNAGTQARKTSKNTHVSAARGTQKTTGTRRRRSASAREKSASQNFETDHIAIRSESEGFTSTAKKSTASASSSQEGTQSKRTEDNKTTKKEKTSSKKKSKKDKKKKKSEQSEERMVNGKRVVVTHASQSNPRSLKSSKPTTSGPVEDPQPEDARQSVANAFGSSSSEKSNHREIDVDEIPAVEEVPNTDSATARRRTPKQEKPSVKSSKRGKDSETKHNVKNDDNTQNVEENVRSYEAAKQRSYETRKTSSDPKSLKRKKK